MQVVSQTKKGICNNCTYNTDCVMEKASSSPIFHCNDYAVEPVVDHTLQKKFPVIEVQPELKGLCGYCDHKEDCKIRAKNDIKITCEEYK